MYAEPTKWQKMRASRWQKLELRYFDSLDYDPTVSERIWALVHRIWAANQWMLALYFKTSVTGIGNDGIVEKADQVHTKYLASSGALHKLAQTHANDPQPSRPMQRGVSRAYPESPIK